MLQGRRRNAVLLILLLPALACPAELVAPYVNTVREDVELMLDLASVGPGDYLIDLGAGDGRIVIAAAQRGARGHGIELQPELVALANDNAGKAGLGDRVRFIEGDIFAADLSRATVVTAYLFPEANLQLRPKLLAELPPGTRVVSNAFHMGDWRPDRHEYGRTSGGAMLWIIPARIGGDWILEIDGRQLSMHIEQRYQEIELQIFAADEQIPVRAAALEGKEITFHTGEPEPWRFSGVLNGQLLAGQAQPVADRAAPVSWQARRESAGTPALAP